MAHGRIETTPEQQLAELRLAYARYTTLAERWHEDSAIDVSEREAREQDARRIAHAYEKSIASSAMRMESIRPLRGEEHRLGPLTIIAGALVIAAASAAVLVSQRPDLVHVLKARVMAAMPAPTHMVAVEPAPVVTPAPLVAAPSAAPSRPTQTEAKAQAKPIAPPKAPAMAAITPSPRIAAPVAPATPVAKPVAPPAARLAAIAPNRDEGLKAASDNGRVQPRDAARASTTPAVAPTPAPTPAPALALAPAPPSPAPAPQPPALEPLAPPREVASLPKPSPLTETQTAPPINAAPAPVPATKLVAVQGTHLLPPYPVDAKRAGEQGMTQMQVSISTTGVITDCRVIASSGSQRLDGTACNFVQRVWRWQPPTQGGQPVPATTKISVIWNLKEAR